MRGTPREESPMSDSDHKIIETLGRLSAAQPRPEATARALAAVRAKLTTNMPATLQRRGWRNMNVNRYAKLLSGLAAAAAITLAVFVSWPGTRNGSASAAEIMRQGIAAVANLKSV